MFIYVFVTKKVGVAHFRNAMLGISAVVFLGLMSHFLTLQYPPGLLQAFVDMPWWIGGSP